MKKVIEGKVYNTDTATLIGSHENSNKNSFYWFYEELYCTKNGTYFLSGEGYGLSPYAGHSCDGMRGPGEGMRVLDLEEAKDWVEAHMSANTYCKLFGEIEG